MAARDSQRDRLGVLSEEAWQGHFGLKNAKLLSRCPKALKPADPNETGEIRHGNL